MDPFTIGLILQAGTAAYGALSSKKKQKEYEAQAAEQEAKRKAAFEDLANIDFSPGSGIYDLQQQRMLAAELKGSEALRRQEDQQARAISALAADPRNVGATLRMTDQDKSDAILARQGEEKIAALAPTVQAEENARNQKIALDRELAMLKYGEATAGETAFREAGFGEAAARDQLLTQVGGSAAELFTTMGAERRKDERLQAELDAMSQTQGTGGTQGSGAVKDFGDTPDYAGMIRDEYGAQGTATSEDAALRAATAGDDFADLVAEETAIAAPIEQKTRYESMSDDRRQDYDENLDILREYSDIDSWMFGDNARSIDEVENELQRGKYGIDPTGESRRRPSTIDLEELGLIEGSGRILPVEGGQYFFDEGDDFADGGKTEGEYDHSTNKKAIVDEENGQKEGEMTGGEYILPEYFVEEVEELREAVKKAREEGDEEKAEEILEEIGRKYLEFTSAERFQGEGMA